jgi:hypothetical protein
VIVAMDDQLRTVPRQHGAKIGAVDQPFQASRRRADRRMMDHDDAKQTLACAAVERFGKPGELLATKPSRCHERRGRNRGR